MNYYENIYKVLLGSKMQVVHQKHSVRGSKDLLPHTMYMSELIFTILKKYYC